MDFSLKLSAQGILCGIIIFIITFAVVYGVGVLKNNLGRKRAAQRREFQRYSKALNSTYYFCPYCGTKTIGNQMNCQSCGAPLGNAEIKYKANSGGFFSKYL